MQWGTTVADVYVCWCRQRIAEDLAVRELEDIGRDGEKVDEEEVRENVVYRLEMLGYRVGWGIVEK